MYVVLAFSIVYTYPLSFILLMMMVRFDPAHISNDRSLIAAISASTN